MPCTVDCFRLFRRVGYAVASLALLVGCSDKAPEREKVVPVSGTVMYKGQPVVGASVGFWGSGSARPALAMTNAQGKFRVTTYEAGDGAILGEHKVTVSKSTTAGDDADLTKQETMEEAAANSQKPRTVPQITYAVPEKYGTAETTDLRFTVKEGDKNDFTIEIKD